MNTMRMLPIKIEWDLPAKYDTTFEMHGLNTQYSRAPGRLEVYSNMAPNVWGETSDALRCRVDCKTLDAVAKKAPMQEDMKRLPYLDPFGTGDPYYFYDSQVKSLTHDNLNGWGVGFDAEISFAEGKLAVLRDLNFFDYNRDSGFICISFTTPMRMEKLEKKTKGVCLDAMKFKTFSDVDIDFGNVDSFILDTKKIPFTGFKTTIW